MFIQSKRIRFALVAISDIIMLTFLILNILNKNLTFYGVLYPLFIILLNFYTLHYLNKI